MNVTYVFEYTCGGTGVGPVALKIVFEHSMFSLAHALDYSRLLADRGSKGLEIEHWKSDISASIGTHKYICL